MCSVRGHWLIYWREEEVHRRSSYTAMTLHFNYEAAIAILCGYAAKMVAAASETIASSLQSIVPGRSSSSPSCTVWQSWINSKGWRISQTPVPGVPLHIQGHMRRQIRPAPLSLSWILLWLNRIVHSVTIYPVLGSVYTWSWYKDTSYPSWLGTLHR